jgi:hypothetical protein
MTSPKYVIQKKNNVVIIDRYNKEIKLLIIYSYYVACVQVNLFAFKLDLR